MALVAAGGGYALTSAAFTDSESVAGNTVGTATLQIGDAVKQAVTTTDLLPGYPATLSEDVLSFSNGGSVPFSYTVSVDNIASALDNPSELPGWIDITITSGGQSESGTLEEPPTLTIERLAVDGAADVDVSLGLDGAATNAAQGRTVGFDLVVVAEQLDAP